MQPLLTDYRVGELVRVRDAVWRIADVRRYRECQALRLAGAEPCNRGVDRTLLAPFDRPARIARRDRPHAVSRRQLLRAIAAAVLSHAPWGGLAAAVDARVELLAYQLEPALAMLRGLATRVLLADEVGLGKTIQAGLILNELARRGEADRVLVLVPAGLRQQWADEFAQRFALGADIADAAWLRRTAAALPRGVNPWSTSRAFIASIDFIKRPEILHALQSLVWDLIIIDEAHASAGASDRHRAAHGLTQRARRVVLITATPHTGDERAFASLCDLGGLERGESDPILMFRRSRADAGFDVTRRTRVVAVRPTDPERRMHRLLERYTSLVWREASARVDRDALLAMTVLRKRALSSAASLAASVERRLAWLAGEPDDAPAQLPLPFDADGESNPEDEAPHHALAAAGFASRTRELEWLRALEASAREAAGDESKIAALARLLRRTHEPVIVFTEYRDTLGRLERVVAPIGRVAVLHGGLTRGERAEAVSRFNGGSVRILLATDAGGEGLNLQARCRWVVNFELPWSPARLEQRLGRVDRLGQTRATHGSHLVARDTSELLVLRNLSARMTRAVHALGERAMPAAALSETAIAARILGGARIEAASPAESPASRVPIAPDPALRDAAASEARRVADLRRLARLARGVSSGAPDAALEIPAPAAGRLRARGRRRSCRTHRLPPGALFLFAASIVDAQGRAVDSQLAIAHVPAGVHGARDRDWRAALDALLAGVRDPISSALRRQVADRLDSILPLHRAAVDRQARREALLLAHAREPLARSIVQPGLFDRRALRQAAEERRLEELAVADAERHVARLRARLELGGGEAELIAAVAIQ